MIAVSPAHMEPGEMAPVTPWILLVVADPRKRRLARAWSVADFEHGPIAVVEAGLPALIIDGGGFVAANLEEVKARLEAKGCNVLHLVDGSGLPEELTPITLAVSGQLLAHHVAVARGFDPDRPRTIQKVTRTW